MTNDIFYGADGLQKWRRNSIQNANTFYYLSIFKNNRKTRQLTKCCVKCLDICKKSRQQTKRKHGRQGSRCKDCGGSQICEQCKDCGGSQVCEHNKIKSQCKDCGGGGICEHGRQRSQCKDCGGSQICEHTKIKSQFKDCGGGGICEHRRQRPSCPTCDPLGHLAGVVQSRIYTALKNDKEMGSTEYLGCNTETFQKHIEQQFTEGMS